MSEQWAAHDEDGCCWRVDRGEEFGPIYPLPKEHALVIAAAPEMADLLGKIERYRPELERVYGMTFPSLLRLFDEAHRLAARARGDG